MDIQEIQRLIKDGRVITPSNLDLANMYVQVGVFQNGNRTVGPSDANAYKAYVCPATLLGGGGPLPVDNKRFIRVDATFGNDSTAQKYNEFLPFQSMNAAITAAVPGDLIIVDPAPGQFDYFITVNMFIPGVSYYFMKGVIMNVFAFANASTASANVYYTVISGSGFIVGETVTNGLGGVGTIVEISSFGYSVISISAGTFNAGETITGGTSGTQGSVYYVDTNVDSNISILGDGDIRFYAATLLGGAYNGNFILEADKIFYQQNSFYGGGFSGNVTINAYTMTLAYGGSSNFYWDNPGYFFGASRPNRCIMTVDTVLNQGSAFILYRDNVELRFNFKNYTYAGFGGTNAKDFYKTNFGSGGFQPSLTYDVVNTINIGKFVCNKRELVAFGIPISYSDSSFIFPAGSNRSKTIITGNYTYIGNGINDGGISCLIQALGCSEQIFFNGIANIESGSMFSDFNSFPECKVVIEGKVYVDNSVINFVSYLHSVYFIVGCNFQLKADTIVNNPVNPCLTQSSYDVGSLPTSQVEIVNCQLVNTNAAGLQPALIQQLGPFLGPAVWGYTRLNNAKLVTTGALSINGLVPGQQYEIISAYMNKPSSLVTNLLAAPLGEIVDPAITSNNL